MGRGAFNPVISDGRTIFLTGYYEPVRAQAGEEEIGRIGKPAAAQRRLDLGDAIAAVVEDRGAQDRVGAGLEPFDQMPRLARAARGDHRHVDGGRDRPRQVEFVAVLGAVAVHARQQDLPRAALDALARPLDGVLPGRRAPAGDVGLLRAAGRCLASIASTTHWAPKTLGQLVDQLRPGERRRVDRHLVRARRRAPPGRRRPRDTAADRERHEHVVGRAPGELHDRRALVVVAVMSRKTSSSAPCAS